MKRRLLIVAAVAALGLALWFWRSQRSPPTQSHTAALGSGAAANGSGSAQDSRNRAARVDPSTLPRASITGTVKDAMGVAVALITGLVTLYRFQENWIEYRTTAETLKHEKYLYLTRSAPYDGDNAFHRLVVTIESTISKETTAWSQSLLSQTRDKGTG